LIYVSSEWRIDVVSGWLIDLLVGGVVVVLSGVLFELSNALFIDILIN